MDVAGGDTSLRRRVWLGPATIVASVLAVSAVRAILVALIPLDSWTGSVMASHETEIVTGVLATAAVVSGMLQLMVLHVVAWAVTVRMLNHALTVSPTVNHPAEGSPKAAEDEQ